MGHGPFSHVFESITNYDHKEMTFQFAERRLPEIVSTFSGEEIKKILNRELKPENAWCGDLLDGQIDVDRMDFLLRDALYAGVDYGRFDVQRVFQSLAIGEVKGENHLLILLKGLHAVEGFFIAYHHMYWQVYLHKTTRAYEILLEKIFGRIKELLLGEGLDISIQPELENLLTRNRLDLGEFFLLDDCTILEAIKKCRSSKDEIINDLSNRFLNRKLFKCIRRERAGNIVEIIKKSQEFFEKRDISHEYYFKIDEPRKISVRRPLVGTDLLMVDVDRSGRISEPFNFIDRSDIIRPLYNVERTEFRMYCPEHLADDLRELLSGT
ncbi:MAG: hypothetical protein HXS54_10895 [Theionarchaea archaeon]|nr:hypothetical protein [Theionarchaea archaeon]